MPASKVKNLAILILALVNGILLLLVVPLVQERHQQRAQAEASLEALFARYGLQLDAGELPETRLLYTVEFSPGEDAAEGAMRALLGEAVLREDDSTRYLQIYQSEQGRCRVSRDGQLTARLEDRASAGDLQEALTEELAAMGLMASEVSLPARTSAGVYTVTALQELLGVPVFSAALQGTFHNGGLTRLEGTAYFDTAGLARTDDEACCSAADALVAFLGSQDALGWVGSSVTAVTQGYLRAETASAAVVRLVPGWRITTDTGDFWVAGIDRQVSALAA